MAASLNFNDELWKSFGNPAQNEKRRFDLRSNAASRIVRFAERYTWRAIHGIQKIQNPMGVGHDARFLVIPGRVRDPVLEIFDLKPVLDIERKQQVS